MDNNPTPPDNTLYQYRPPKQWAFDNLQKGVVYFGAPRNFNDPHDFHTPARIDLSDNDARSLLASVGADDSPQNKMQALRKVLAGMLDSPDMTEEQLRGELKSRGMRGIPQGCTLAAVKEIVEYVFNRTLKDILVVERNVSGVTCFTERNDNLLMWSRYADNDKGFCLGFNARDLEASIDTMFFPVKYTSALPECNFPTLLREEYDVQYAKFLAHKSPYWSNEKEWRFFKQSAGAAPYDKKALKSVYLGAAADKRTKELVYAIVRRKYGRTKIFEAKRSDKEPAVVFNLYHP